MDTQQSAHPAPRTLAAFALNRLPPEARERMQAHLSRCAQCTDFLARTPRHELQSLLGAPQQSRAEQSTPGERTRDTVETPAAKIGQQKSPAAAAPSPSISPESIPPALRQQAKYRIMRLLGRGGMGSVYQAHHERMDRMVAIKVINPDLVDNQQAIDRFNAEVIAVAKLDHRNIARAYDAETFGSLQTIVMEFVPGQTVYDFMKARLKAGNPLSVSEACRLVRQALVGLQHAHERGIAHRDLKPQNLMLTRDEGIVKILDFGLAKLTSDRSHGLTKTNVTMGTYEYLSPEQALDAASADIRSDIYSLGCTLYYLLAGKLPFDYPTDAKLLMAHQTEIAKPLSEIRPDVPRAVSDLVARMLAKKPEDRHQTPAEAAQVLLPFARGENPLPGAALPSGALPDDVMAMIGGQAALSGTRLQTSKAESTTNPLASFVRRRWIPISIVAMALAAAGIMAFAGLFKIRTPEGTITLSVNQPDAEVAVDGQKITVQWGADHKTAEISAPPGTHRIEVKKQGFAVSGNDLTIEDGGHEILSVALLPNQPLAATPIPAPGESPGVSAASTSKTADGATPPPATNDTAPPPAGRLSDPAFQQWMNDVAAMPAEQQVRAVVKKMQELNPSFDGNETHKIENGVVTELQFVTDNVTDISPVRALRGLASLDCHGAKRKGVLADLSPLQGMRLTSLRCGGNPVSDLSPLKGMPLRELICWDTSVSDLSPLEGMDLRWLECGDDSALSDLSPLKGVPLTTLWCRNTHVVDLSPLTGMPLAVLACNYTAVSDLSPLAGMHISELYFTPSNITKGTEVIRKMTSLKTIHADGRGFPPEEFWKKYDAGEFGKASAVGDTEPVQTSGPPSDGSFPLGQWVDVLRLVDTDRMAVSGTWSRNGQEVSVEPSVGARIKIPALVNGSYDLEVDFTRLKGSNGIGTLLSVGSHPCMVILSGSAPHRVSALSLIDGVGADYPRNPTAVRPGTVENGRRHRLLVSVRAESDVHASVDVSLDGKPYLPHWAGNPAALSQFPGWSLPDPRELGLGAYQDEVTFHSARLKMLSGSASQDAAAASNGTPSDRLSDPALQQWMKSVAAMPAEQQVLAVVKKLRELNPNFDGKETHKIENGVVISFQLSTEHVTDISPVRALAQLTDFDCSGTFGNRSNFSDLSPLRGMPLINLGCRWTRVSDLSPLERMPLKTLSCRDSLVADLSPLAETRLSDLNVSGTPVSNLSPLKGLPLQSLNCGRTRVRDLAPLQGTRLTTLGCHQSLVADLSPLRGMPLTELGCEKTPVSDLSPLAGMNLKAFNFTPNNIVKGIDIVRDMASMETIGITFGRKNQLAPGDFWKRYDAGEFGKPAAQ